MDYLRIEVTRESYAPDQVERTMTVGELKEFLEDFDSELPIYVAHDRGYTYGGIHMYDIMEDTYEI